jgi:PAS domain S-box-containing protein
MSPLLPSFAGQTQRCLRWCLLCAALCLASRALAADAEPAKRVLLVHSFGSSAPPFTTHSTAFETTLTQEMGKGVDLDEVSLDMARYAQPDMEEPFAELLSKRLAKWQPDLVVPIGSPAGRFVARFRDRLFPRTPILYTGMDKRTLPADALANNATFVGEAFDLKGLVEDILQLQPDTNHIVVILGATPLERYWTDAFREAFGPFANRVKFTWVNDLSFEQMLELVSKLPPHSFVLLGLLIRDASGVTHNEDEALQRLRAVAHAPINGLYQNQVGLGIVGGRLYQGELEGEESARVAIRILRGEPVSSFQPRIIGTLGPRYDSRELRRWKISESRLPAGSLVMFREPMLWERYRWWIVGVLALIALETATIFALVIQRRRRRRAQEALRESQQLMELATGAGELGLWSRDVSGGEVWLNGPMRALFGFSANEVVRFTDIFARIHPDDRNRMVAELRRAQADEVPFEGEFRLPLEDGIERWILAKGRTVAGPDGGDHVDQGGRRRMGVVLDITQRKRVEAELRRSRDELAHMSRLTTMGELAASLAHELNQPLAAVLANARAAQRYLAKARGDIDIDEVRAIVSDIVGDNRRASEIILRMRSLARKETLELTTLDLPAVIREIAVLVQGGAAMRNVRVSLDIGPNLPPVRGDKVQLQQVLLNLLLNAFAAIEEDCPEEQRQIVLRVALEEGGSGAMVRTCIRDCGPGLAPEAIEKSFQPFYTTKADGLGMGLPISRSIIEAHGGRLWAQNNHPDLGATFCFTVPSTSTVEAEPETAATATAADAATTATTAKPANGIG